MLTQKATGLSGAERLEIQTTALNVDATSKIDVSARGYLGAYEGGNNSTNGRTLNNATGSVYNNGGSYGGVGAISNWGGSVNGAYGDLLNPNETGSGGGGNGSS